MELVEGFLNDSFGFILVALVLEGFWKDIAPAVHSVGGGGGGGGGRVFGPETTCLIVSVLGEFGHGGTLCFVFLSYLHYLLCMYMFSVSKTNLSVHEDKNRVPYVKVSRSILS